MLPKDMYRTRRCLSHTPGAGFQARLLDNQEGANTERYVSGKLSARCFQRPPSWHRHYSNCGDIDHGKSAQAGAIYAPSSTVAPAIYDGRAYESNLTDSRSKCTAASSSSILLCVFFTLNRSFYPSTAHPVSVPILPPTREIQALWSQNHDDRDLLLCSAVSKVDSAMTCHRTGYDRYDIHNAITVIAIQIR